MKPIRSFDGRAEPVDSGRAELVAILNAFRTNIDVSGTNDAVVGKALWPVITAQRNRVRHLR